VENKKVVVTGGGGFIGSNLAEGLATNNDVVIIDDLSTGRIDNIAGLIKNNNVSFIHDSILNLTILEDTFNGADYVFHEAALGSVPRSIEDPLSTNQVNITGTLNLLIAAMHNSVKKVIIASSSAVYGETPSLPKKEEMPPNPKSPYALTKLVDEYYCELFSQIYGLPTVCLRYFNVYGPRQDPDSQYAAVIPSFISRVLRNKPPVIYGDGEQTRDLTYVEDVVKANILAAESDASGVFNVGTGESISINGLARIIISTIGKNLKPEYQPARPGDVRDSLADVTRARTIGYKSQYNLEEGLHETILRFTDDR